MASQNLGSIGSYDGLSPVQHQANTRTNADLLSMLTYCQLDVYLLPVGAAPTTSSFST